MRLERGMVRALWGRLLDRLGKPITVAYVPGQAEISYDEKADKLAGSAEPFGELIRHPEDILGELHSRFAQASRDRANEWRSTEQLIEKGWDFDQGASIILKGPSRVLHCQMEPGVIS